MAFLGRKVCTLYPQRFCQWPAPTECPVAEGKGLRVSWSPFHHGGHYLEHWSCSVDAGEVDGNSTTLSSISTEEHRTQAAQAARHTDSVTLRREFLEDCGSFQHCCGVKLFVKEGSTQSLLEDLKILAECRRRALPGGHRRVFRTRTSLTWSMPTGSTSSAGTGNPPAHPGPWSLCPTEPGSTVAAMMSWRGCWWGSGCWCSPMTTCLKNMLIFLAFVNMRVTLLPEEFPGAQPVVGSVKSRVRSGREALAASMSLPVGHGQSEGERMVVSDFQVFIRDVLQHVDVVQKDHPGLPIFLLGHSMVPSSGLWAGTTAPLETRAGAVRSRHWGRPRPSRCREAPSPSSRLRRGPATSPAWFSSPRWFLPIPSLPRLSRSLLRKFSTSSCRTCPWAGSMLVCSHGIRQRWTTTTLTPSSAGRG
ncbi:monoglyceride lipase isoform X6 [Hippopotamus amphibius kiboko]|uniref:monoglyceride lipase isoform X6 n=1 Tax=Hippopotamus amphibius kiboko TaxID=575201 RepID=UPI00259A1C7D|nr:monoglyceride lipase isoform X6 [Hippopotamus amphibius kiboko]